MPGMPEGGATRVSAGMDFQRARRRAALRSVFARLLGTDSDRLLPYEEVRRRLRAVEGREVTLQDVPLDAIVGSVGRYQDFTREFMPLFDEDKGRWVGVRMAMTGLEGVPPVELYRVGDAYFVKDGNHRVSVARQLGAKTINAYVTPVHTRVPLGPDAGPDELTLAGDYASFLEETGIDRLRPEADLRLTASLRYVSLLEHIRVHQYYMGIDEGRPVGWEEAVAHWYDTVYLPVAREIEEHDLLSQFPNRTVTDLYLFLSEHRGRLERELGWSLEGPQLAVGLSPGFGLEEQERRLRQSIGGDAAQKRAVENLVDGVLVVMSGSQPERTLTAALEVAAVEDAKLLALRLGLPARGEAAAREREEFARRAQAAGVEAQLAVVEREPIQAILARAAYVNLVVVAGPEPGEKMEGWLRSLLRRCPRPVLVVRDAPVGYLRPLVAYDGRARADLALFAAAYLAVTLGSRPAVVSVSELGRPAEPLLDRADAYLRQFGVEADLHAERGAVDAAILAVSERVGADLILMGSYKYNRWLEELTGSLVDRVVAGTQLPVLVT